MRVQASKREGIGLPKLPARNPDHEDPQWFERDLDGDDYKQTDKPYDEPLPSDRHKTVPGFPS